MNNRIVIYGDKASRASTSSLKEEFERALGPAAAAQTDIIEATAADILTGNLLDEHTLAFVLPGIIGEKSLYHEHLGERGNEIIRAYVEDGGTFMGLCAGGYYAAQTIEYVPEWGPTRGHTQGLLALFNGLARGPVANLGTAPSTPDAYNGCSTAPVQLANGQRGEIAYSCGPAFYNLPAQATVLAHYDTPEKPVAAFMMEAGKGMMLLSGVLPQYGAPEGWQKPAIFHPVDLLIEKLAAHEQTRRGLWDRMVGVITHQARQRPGL